MLRLLNTRKLIIHQALPKMPISGKLFVDLIVRLLRNLCNQRPN